LYKRKDLNEIRMNYVILVTCRLLQLEKLGGLYMDNILANTECVRPQDSDRVLIVVPVAQGRCGSANHRFPRRGLLHSSHDELLRS
jgi:hypothetical protein